MAIVNEVRLGVSGVLDQLLISSSDFLDEVDCRSLCPKCGRSRKYFCYSCYVCMEQIAHRIPNVKLPLKVDIIKHPRETDGKSTAVHAALLAPHDVNIYTFPQFPDYADKSKLLMVFPGKDSVTFPELVERFCKRDVGVSSTDSPSNTACSAYAIPEAEPELYDNEAGSASEREMRTVKSKFPFERVILIDSTWNQVRSIRKDERLQGIVRLELSERETCFWRFQRGKPRTYLATIEAVYYFFVELHTLLADAPYRGQYDNLLFFFKFMFSKIHSLYEPERMRVYTFNQQLPPPPTKHRRRPRATDPSDAVR